MLQTDVTFGMTNIVHLFNSSLLYIVNKPELQNDLMNDDGRNRVAILLNSKNNICRFVVMALRWFSLGRKVD